MHVRRASRRAPSAWELLRCTTATPIEQWRSATGLQHERGGVHTCGPVATARHRQCTAGVHRVADCRTQNEGTRAPRNGALPIATSRPGCRFHGWHRPRLHLTCPRSPGVCPWEQAYALGGSRCKKWSAPVHPRLRSAAAVWMCVVEIGNDEVRLSGTVKVCVCVCVRVRVCEPTFAYTCACVRVRPCATHCTVLLIWS